MPNKRDKSYYQWRPQLTLYYRLQGEVLIVKVKIFYNTVTFRFKTKSFINATQWIYNVHKEYKGDEEE